MSPSTNKLDAHMASPDGAGNARATVIDFGLLDAAARETGEAPSIYKGGPRGQAVVSKGVKHTPTLAGLPEAGERAFHAEVGPSRRRPDILPAPSAEQQRGRILQSVSKPGQEVRPTDQPNPSAPIAPVSRAPTWEALFDLELGIDRRFLVAQLVDGNDLLLIQRIEEPGARMKLSEVQKNLSFIGGTHHENIATPIHTLNHAGALLIAWEFMPMSLVEIARSRFLSEARVATILDQGLSTYTVKGGLEGCRASDKSSTVNTSPLKRLTVELVNGDYNKEGYCGITNPQLQSENLWDFLSDLDKYCNFSTLQQHKLFNQKGAPKILLGLVAYANYFYHWMGKYPPSSRDLYASTG
ncbi:hypothetical protein PCL_08375 [Purpureocillium lilacinum]|uniref:Uncharacterized protein n=1 Tax=Purpureocillium lilacinum TaxID=33203 RepID=A0A2U3DRY7_PURLI|nr:hypothetical protein PCL_08375 [Purpureocillium lilacinum]